MSHQGYMKGDRVLARAKMCYENGSRKTEIHEFKVLERLSDEALMARWIAGDTYHEIQIADVVCLSRPRPGDSLLKRLGKWLRLNKEGG